MSLDLDKLIQSVPGVVYQFRIGADSRWAFSYLSNGVRDLFECSPEDGCEDISRLLDCVQREDRGHLFRSVRRSQRRLDPWSFEFCILTPSGRSKWVRGHSLPEAGEDGGVVWNGILVDISLSKKTEARLLRLQEMYAAVMEVHHLVANFGEIECAFAEICRIAVERGGMVMAWIGMLDAGGQYLNPVARFGDGLDILDVPDFFARIDIVEQRGQAATAFAENRTVLNQDFLRHPSTRRWHELGRSFGFGSSASFPIREKDRPSAVLTVYRREVDAFDAESVALLERLSADISHAMTRTSTELERERLEEALRFRQFGLDRADEEVYWVDRQARIVDANLTACSRLGYAREELLRLQVFDIDPYVTAEKWPQHWRELERATSIRLESYHRRKDGSLYPTEILLNTFEYCGERFLCALVRDTSQRKEMEKALDESEARFNLFMDALPAAAFIKSSEGKTIYLNRYMTDIIGVGHWQCKTTQELFPADLAERMLEDDRQAIEVGDLVREEALPHANGEVRIYRTHKFRIPRQDAPPLLGGVAIDVTEQKQMEERVWNLAFFDVLTGLPNRRMLLERLEQAIRRARRYHCALAVMFLDLDHFKKINDTLGHDVGDALLVEVALRLRECVREGDTVSRHGGDEFIILLPEISHPGDAALVAEKIVAAVDAPVRVGDHELSISTSVGIAVRVASGSDSGQELLKKADIAMYSAKEAGRNGYRFYSDTAVA